MAQKKEQKKLERYDLTEKNKVLIDAYESYEKDPTDENRAAYIATLVMRLKPIVNGAIAKSGFVRACEYDDLYDQAMEECIRKAGEYDPRKSMPTSYFSMTILQGLKKALTVGNRALTENFLSYMHKLNKAARENGYEDCTDENLTIERLALLSGISEVTVRSTIELIKITHVELMDADEQENDRDIYHMDPCSLQIKQEESEFLAAALLTLEDFDQYLIMRMVMDETPTGHDVSGAAIEKELSEHPELLEQFGLDRVPSAAYIIERKEKALRKLKNIPAMRARYREKYKKPDRSFTIVEQAPASTILSQINTKNLKVV